MVADGFGFSLNYLAEFLLTVQGVCLGRLLHPHSRAIERGVLARAHDSQEPGGTNGSSYRNLFRHAAGTRPLLIPPS
jgi:hypothetical protein